MILLLVQGTTLYLFSRFRIFVHHKLEENQIPTLTCLTVSLHLRDANYHSTIIRRIYYELEKPVRYQGMVVESPSLNSPERNGGDGWCWANLQNARFTP
ncbi:hypothetical protein KM92DES2_11606 [uncultured Desulfovibrio sp.]|uniref:Uncharacterized protein n=1 Tax=uncultured Desulfovibrio sp. TaxID=167968 RepID=A0A212JRQ0_9BACT|nr:hypothetical protein KM92DES2_11606 [uncultured Desulfovibrio sp.]